MNSLVCDYVMRIKQSGMNVNLFLLKQVPVLSPSQFDEYARDFIVPRVAALTRTSDDLCAVWLSNCPRYYYQSPEERCRIRAELDAYIARMYRLTRRELEYILSPASVMGADFPTETFPGLQRDETVLYGEFLTKRLVLEAYDKLEAGELK